MTDRELLKEPQPSQLAGALCVRWGALWRMPDGRRMTVVADSVSVGARKSKIQRLHEKKCLKRSSIVVYRVGRGSWADRGSHTGSQPTGSKLAEAVMISLFDAPRGLVSRPGLT